MFENKTAKVHVFGHELFALIRTFGIAEPQRDNKRLTNSFTLFYMAKRKIHIEEIICQKLKAEGRTKKWLAEQVYCNQSNFCKILQKPTIDTGLLMQISLVLKDDLFSLLTNYHNDNQQDSEMQVNNSIFKAQYALFKVLSTFNFILTFK
jgi:hypothetical protein